MAVAKPSLFDWSLIQSFVATLDQGSLMGAARVLRTSQPTVGRHIAALEQQLGVLLFERTGRAVVPTPAALRLAEGARSMADGADQLARMLAGTQSNTKGTVRISASTPVAIELLPPIFSRMRQSLPDIQVELVATNRVSNLLRREADIAVRMVRPDQATLIAKKLGDVGIGAYAHRSYLARHSPLQQPADLLKHDLIGSDADTSILDGFRHMGYNASKEMFAFRTDDFIAQWQAVRAGLGIGFLADYVAVRDPDVLPVLPQKLPIRPLPMWLVVHREIRSSQRIRLVYDFLAASLSEAIRR